MNANEEYKENGFDLLRYAAALSVMMLHYSSYSMILSKSPTLKAAAFMDGARRFTLLFPGVVILFAISGFLVSASFERAKTRNTFFLKRARRIYPELWICTLINLAVICVLVPERLDHSIVVWLVMQFFGIANTPVCLKTLPTGSANGALWTVFTEVQLYLVLGFIYPFLKKMKNSHWAAFLFALAALNLACAAVARDGSGMAAKVIERLFIPYALWFFIGVFCFQRRQKILPVLKKAFLPMLIVYLIAGAADIQFPGYYTNIVTSVMIPFLAIGGAYCLPKIRLKPDFSYGMFLYHWIILNIITLFDLMDRLPWYAGLSLFIVGTVTAAVVSWAVCGRCGRVWRKCRARH